MPKKVKLFAAGVFLALVGVACVALVARVTRVTLDALAELATPARRPYQPRSNGRLFLR